MEKIELNAKARTVTGKKVKQLRRQGVTPANLYGHGLKSMAIEADTKELQRVISRGGGGSRLIAIHIDNKAPVQALLRGYKREPDTHLLLHVDFYQVRMGETIKVSVPVVLVGEAPGLKLSGATLMHGITVLEVESLPGNLPPNIEVDISSLAEPDQTIHVRDLAFADGVKVLAEPDDLVVKLSVKKPEVAEEEVEEEKAAPAAAESEKTSRE